MSDYVIRPLTAAELQHAVDWAGREGWNPGQHDTACFRPTDPHGFLGGFLDGEMIASVSAVNYDDAFSFLGFYIVRPEFRGSGHGLEIAQHALAHCEGRNMGLDGVVEQQDNYRKSGFTFAYNNYRFTGTKTGILAALGSQATAHISVLTEISEDLLTYDRALFPAPRSVFLREWLRAPSHASRAFIENGMIKGYVTLRPARPDIRSGLCLQTIPTSHRRCWSRSSTPSPRITQRMRCLSTCPNPTPPPLRSLTRWDLRRSLRPHECIRTMNPIST